MTKSVFSIFFFFFISLLLLLAAASASASAGNATSGLRYGGCVPGNTVGECIIAEEEEEKEEGEEGVEVVVRRILQQRRKLSYEALQKQPFCNSKIYGSCIGRANKGPATCTYNNRCKRG